MKSAMEKALAVIMVLLVAALLTLPFVAIWKDYNVEREKTAAYYECLRIQEKVVQSDAMYTPTCWR